MRLRNGRDARCSIAYSSVLARLAYGDHRHEPKHGERDTLQFPDRSFLKQRGHAATQHEPKDEKPSDSDGQPWRGCYGNFLNAVDVHAIF